MKIKLIVLMVLLLLVTGCLYENHETGLDSNDDNIGEEGENEMAEENIIDRLAEECEEVYQLRQDILDSLDEFNEEYQRGNLSYILNLEDYTPADRNIDLRTIERFIFGYSTDWPPIGYGIVIDKMYGMVYFNPDMPTISVLRHNEIYAEFIEQDLDRLIKAIEKSSLLDWDGVYGNLPLDHVRWRLGILFDDGTMFRSRGVGTFAEALPPEEQFSIFTDFVLALGEEIIERHKAEQNDN